MNFGIPSNISPIGVVIFIIVALIGVGGWYFLSRWMKKHTPEKAKEAENPPEKPQALIWCRCGQAFEDEKALRLHIVQASIKEKGQHGLDRNKDDSGEAIIKYILGPKEKYRCYVRRYPRGHRECEIELTRINEPCGTLWTADASMPESGECYYVKENKDRSIIPYDPRLTDYDNKKTPQLAYIATHPQGVEGTWLYQKNWGEIISQILMGLIIFGTFIIVVISVGGK